MARYEPPSQLSNVCFNALVEWVRRWHVTITREDFRASSPKARVTTRVVETTDQLRTLIEWARTNPYVTGHKVRPTRVLIGDEPKDCPCGARYHTTGDPGRGVRRWRPCSCGGHFVFTCQACSHVVIEPAEAGDCDSAAVPS